MEHSPEILTDPWRHALAALRAHGRAVLVMVVDHSGSVPGVTGARLVVSEDGIAGTIGGGTAEMELVERARNHSGDAAIVRFRHTPNEGGTLCSGLQIFAIILLSQNDIQELQTLVGTLDADQTGTIELSPEGLRFHPGQAEPHVFSQDETSWSYRGPIGLEDTLYIIGGGHVSLALSRVMATLPFRIVVLDDRQELPTMAANSFAHEMRVVELDRVGEFVEEGEHSWAVIMTFGHKHDRMALEGLLGKKLAYLGLMGSAAKVQRLFKDLEAEGTPREDLDGVRAPVGLSIGSHTPEEIAISIAAEIIALRNRNEGPG
ncbi:MAG: XdhC family protein [Thermoanaerobaculales bacterium]